MTGLIWKDALVMRKNIRFYVIFMLAYFGLAVLGVFDASIVISFSTVIIMVLPISCFSFDETAKWDRFCRSLPLESRDIVGARYLFTLLILLVLAACSSMCAVALTLLDLGNASLIENLASMLGSLGAGLFIVDVMLPLCYKLGPERARPYLFAVVLIPFVGLFLLLRFGGDLGLSLEFLNQLPELNALGVIALLPLAGLACLGLSFLISCRIVDQKEFNHAAPLALPVAGAGTGGMLRPAPLYRPHPAGRDRRLGPAGPVRPPPGGGGGVSRFAPGLLRKRPPLCYNKNRKTERGSML